MDILFIWIAIVGIMTSSFVIFVCVRYMCWLVYKRIELKKLNDGIDETMRRYRRKSITKVTDN